ncbi:MAG: hypothetical protein IIA45_08610, partial [Bacteroidetes bacterium]|nr:hypothetical protein [Bacteroidota bacterium]
YESAYFYPDVSYISFVTTTNDSVDFYLEDTYIDSYDNEFFDVKEEEGSIFLVFVNKKGMQGTRYEIHTYAYIREVPQSDGEMEEYYRLKKFLKVEKE